MTTVAWRRGCIAADRQCDGWMDICKLYELPDGSILTGAGHFDEVIEVAAWLKAGAKPSQMPVVDDDPETGTDFIIACPDGKAYWLTSPYLRRVEITSEFFAIGSGEKAALGAMAMGADARRAVEIACQFDDGTGKGVDVIDVTNRKPRKARK